MNIAIFVGRLTAEPTVRQTTSGKTVVSFCLAIQRDKENADFIDCVAWEKTGEFISKYFHKGQYIAIEGAMQTRTYEDSNNAKKKVTECIVRKADFCSNKAETIGTDIQVEENYSSGNLPF